MSKFCLLREPDAYTPLDWDLLVDESARAYWLDLFERNFEATMVQAVRQYGRSAERRIGKARRQFTDILSGLRQAPASLPSGRLDVLELNRIREKALYDNLLGAPYERVKQQHIAESAELYPSVIRGLRGLESFAKWEQLVRGVLVGNAFDLGGAPKDQTSSQPGDFLELLDDSHSRPWLVDDFDALACDLQVAPPAKWTKAVVFVDNSGADFVLGVLPLARELALAGVQIVLAANEKASLNDITADEAIDVIEHLAGVDRDLEALIQGDMFQVVSTGTNLPVLDLAGVSDELNEASADADLVVLVGMGRAVETNFDAKFSVGSLRLAMLKNPMVADRLGGKFQDYVCKYVPVA